MGAVREEEAEEERIQNLRSKATELLLREEFEAAAKLYAEIISLCRTNSGGKLRKVLCLAHSNRAEALARSSRFAQALIDCDEALKIECSHSKTLIRKGKILLNLNRYASAADCFRRAKKADSSDPSLDPLLERCRKLESLSKSGAVDVSGWVAAGFDAKRIPELGEYVGPVEVKLSDASNRGLFSTKAVDSGTVLVITKAVAVDRVIMPRDSGEGSQLVLWKNFVDGVEESVHKCGELNALLSTLSTGERESIPQVPKIDFFKPEAAADRLLDKPPLQRSELVSILDTNSMLEEDGNSAKVLGRNSSSDHHYRSVGLWILPSFINHSCRPNVRRTHIGDHVIVHASRDVAAGEELTFAYFDVLAPPSRRREMAADWGFECRCGRCRFEEEEVFEMMGDSAAVDRLEETMARRGLNAKEKGMLRASFWEAYEGVFTSEERKKKWRGKIPAAETVAESVAEAVGCDERMLRVLSSDSNGVERRLKIGRGIYGKIMKKSALNTLI
ncbi:hypothetical protein M569_04457 [Genlisea aurea]|uniref:SET domain-containing protein n=1 Tax=Genlisea aurea TaxID=192259 RepID=S8CSL8_9LAMI|nr:hypothetical protein M569_04457 [Genlisea aurea]